jgi:BMFP domain-containing protein YqiC
MGNNDYTYWTKPKLLHRIHALESRVRELETECKSLRSSVYTAVDVLSRENTEMKAWLDSQERLWELQDPIATDETEEVGC